MRLAIGTIEVDDYTRRAIRSLTTGGRAGVATRKEILRVLHRAIEVELSSIRAAYQEGLKENQPTEEDEAGEEDEGGPPAARDPPRRLAAFLGRLWGRGEAFERQVLQDYRRLGGSSNETNPWVQRETRELRRALRRRTDRRTTDAD